MDRVTVPEAARRLGITPDGVRKRINRGHIEWEKDEDGRVYVYLDTSTTEADTLRDASATERLIEELKAHNESLRDQLEAERAANRENRRLLAAALERIPAIEAPPDTPQDIPPETPESPVTPSDEEASGDAPEDDTSEYRPWWRRWFGG